MHARLRGPPHVETLDRAYLQSLLVLARFGLGLLAVLVAFADGLRLSGGFAFLLVEVVGDLELLGFGCCLGGRFGRRQALGAQTDLHFLQQANEGRLDVQDDLVAVLADSDEPVEDPLILN